MENQSPQNEIYSNKDLGKSESNSLNKPETFAGLKKDDERASVILYLNANGDNPLKLP